MARSVRREDIHDPLGRPAVGDLDSAPLPDDPHQVGGAHFRFDLAWRLEQDIRPLISKGTNEGGFNCCGCSTYDAILDRAIEIVLGPVLPARSEGLRP